MKKELATIFKFGLGFAGMIIMLWSCNENPSKVGFDLLPSGDLLLVRKDSTVTVANIQAFTQTDGNQRTDEPGFNLLGTLNDPVFGKTTADFAIQFRIDSFPERQNVIEVDSLVLYLLYNELYGDTLTPQKLKVYELGSDLSLNSKYYQDVDLKGMSKSEVLADMDYIPRYKDSLNTAKSKIDTVLQTLRIHLDKSLATKLLAADSLTLSSNDAFINYFKGLYVEAGDLNSGGAIMRIKTVAAGSRLALYYRTEKDTLKNLYKINSNAARVSRFVHDYSNTDFAANLDKTDNQDSLLYLQTTGGLRTKILIPNLGTWKDSTNFAINKAEIIFTVDHFVSDTAHYLPPEQLVFSAIGVDSLGQEIKYLPKDFDFSQIYYNGIYDSTTTTYRFNIANHMQQVIEHVKGKDNLGFYLATSQPSSTFRRVVLKGPGSKAGIKLDVIYSKIK